MRSHIYSHIVIVLLLATKNKQIYTKKLFMLYYLNVVPKLLTEIACIVCIILARKFTKQNDVYYVVPPVVTDWISQVCDDSLQRGKQHIPGEIMFCIFLPFIVFFFEREYIKSCIVFYIYSIYSISPFHTKFSIT